MNTAATTENGLDGTNGSDACRRALSPERALAWNIMKMASNGDLRDRSVSLPELTAILEEQNRAAAEGDLTHVRQILANQVTMLERMTEHLVSRAIGMGPVVDVYERYLKLAFRAQAQCTRTAKLLKEMTAMAAVDHRTEEDTPPASHRRSVRADSSKVLSALVGQGREVLAVSAKVDELQGKADNVLGSEQLG